MRKILAILALAGLAACGDPATEDERGYTKAPLEAPGLLVAGEPTTELAGVPASLEPGLTAVLPEEVTVPVGGAGGGAGAGSGAGAEVTLAAGVSREQFDRGREVFSGAGGCAACHGADATGSSLGPDLTDGEWLHVDSPDVDAIGGVIRSGVPNPQQYPGPMPAMGGASLSDDQIRALAGYVASLGGG